MEPRGPDGTGENDHGTAVLGDDGLVHFIYQERAGDGLPWRIMRATMEPEALRAALEAAAPAERVDLMAGDGLEALPA